MSIANTQPKTLPNDRSNAALDEERLEQEFEMFARYLVGEVPNDDFFERYIAACQNALTDCPPSPYFNFLLRKKWVLGPLEAGLGIISPRDEIRKKLLIATSILEASPEYCDHFLATNRSYFEFVLKLACVGFTSVIKIIVGVVLINFLKEDFGFGDGEKE